MERNTASSRRKKPPTRINSHVSRQMSEETRPLLKGRRTASNIKHQRCRVYDLITRINNDLVTLVDTPLSLEQLATPKIVYQLVRPLENAYLELDNVCIIYALLVVRIHFMRDQTHTLSLHSVNATRAALCEIVATNILRTVYDTETKNPDSTSSDALLKAAELLAAAFSPFQGAPPEILEAVTKRSSGYHHWDGATHASSTSDDEEVADLIIDELPYGKNNALEMAIVGEAKMLIRSPPAQLVVQAIWTGLIVYSPTTFWDLLPDHYKRRQISLHKPSNSIYLDHYRLRVPRIRAFLETLQFLVLFALWIGVLQSHTRFEHFTRLEVVFLIYGLGWALDKFASTLEHGWRVYAANLWNGLDAGLTLNFTIYAILRLIGLGQRSTGQGGPNYWAIDILSLGTLLLFPRLIFTILSDNVFVLSLRAMLSQFAYLMLLAAWCFLGFLYSLWLMAEHNGYRYSLGFIGKLMVWIWFGLDGTGIHIARDFNPILGPVLWLLYSCLANTLLLTILVAILSNTFTNVSHDPASEGMYRRTVTTFDGLKSDAIFGFMPGFNILAVLILTSLRPFVSRRKYHSATVLLTRVFSGPILLIIAIIEATAEKQRRRNMAAEHALQNGYGPRSDVKAKPEGSWSSRLEKTWLALKPRGAHDDISLVFELAESLEHDKELARSGSDGLSAHDDDNLDALLRGMPSLSPAAKATLKGVSTGRGDLAPPSVTASSKDDPSAGESKIMPLARLFGNHLLPCAPDSTADRARPSERDRDRVAPMRRSETPTPASTASMQPDDMADRLEAIEQRLDQVLQALETRRSN